VSDERSAGAVDKIIGDRVRVRRIEIGMSQERLAELLGVTFQQVQKYEKGVNRIASSRLLDISAALDVPVASFFSGLKGSEPRGGAEEMSAALDLPGARELLRRYAALKSPRLRRQILELVHAIGED